MGGHHQSPTASKSEPYDSLLQVHAHHTKGCLCLRSSPWAGEPAVSCAVAKHDSMPATLPSDTARTADRGTGQSVKVIWSGHSAGAYELCCAVRGFAVSSMTRGCCQGEELTVDGHCLHEGQQQASEGPPRVEAPFPVGQDGRTEPLPAQDFFPGKTRPTQKWLACEA